MLFWPVGAYPIIYRADCRPMEIVAVTQGSRRYPSLSAPTHGPGYSVTMSRSYKQGEEWKQADSYGADDLLLLAKLLDQAHTWILEQH